MGNQRIAMYYCIMLAQEFTNLLFKDVCFVEEDYDTGPLEPRVADYRSEQVQTFFHAVLKIFH